MAKRVLLTVANQIAIMQLLPSKGSIARVRLTSGVTESIEAVPASDVSFSDGEHDFIRELLTEVTTANKVTPVVLELINIFLPEFKEE